MGTLLSMNLSVYGQYLVVENEYEESTVKAFFPQKITYIEYQTRTEIDNTDPKNPIENVHEVIFLRSQGRQIKFIGLNGEMVTDVIIEQNKRALFQQVLDYLLTNTAL